MRTMSRFCLLSLSLLPLSAKAQTTEERPFLSPLFSDNMVVQRDIAAPIWGWTTPGTEVKVTIEGKTITTKAGADGKWMAKLPKHKAGGNYSIAIMGPEKVVLSNVTFGDVWVCSGQSNMEWGIKLANNPTEEISAANYPNLRLFTVQKRIAYQPVTGIYKDPQNLFGVWSPTTPDTVSKGGGSGFSAVAYFFGRELHRETGVPIGLIHTSWGGTIAEAWVSKESLSAMPDFTQAISQVQAVPQGTVPDNAKNNPNVVTVLNNAMIHPLLPFAIKGAIWYQGESNAGRAEQYRQLLPTLISDWRKQFEVGDFPFYIVQLANFMAQDPEPKSDAWPLLREAQTMTAQNVKNAGIALAIDIGDEKDIHPRNKQDVGRRLALNALAKVYKKNVVSSGPTFQTASIEGNTICVKFANAKGGLLTKNGEKVMGFAIAGEDKKFVYADATAEGEIVKVWSDKVPNPKYVRYAWANNPVCNLYNKAGLPAVPFRTDK